VWPLTACNAPAKIEENEVIMPVQPDVLYANVVNGERQKGEPGQQQSARNVARQVQLPQRRKHPLRRRRFVRLTAELL
jgi:hypothetical protein